MCRTQRLEVEAVGEGVVAAEAGAEAGAGAEPGGVADETAQTWYMQPSMVQPAGP